MEKEFKVGDTVELLRDSFRTDASLKKGDIGNITKIEGQIVYINVSRKRHNSNNNSIHLSGLKLLKNELPIFKIIKYRNKKITMVQNNEGNIFGIGDIVKFLPKFGRSVQDVNKIMTITGFRYRNDRTNLCAITDIHPEYGVGIEKIQHVLEFEKEFILPAFWHVKVNKETQTIISKWYSKDFTIPLNSIAGIDDRLTRGWNPQHILKGLDYDFGKEITFEQFKKYVLKEEIVKEETLLEKAKRLYPIGTKFKGAFKNRFDSDKILIIEHQNFTAYHNGITNSDNYWLFFNNQWAEIIE